MLVVSTKKLKYILFIITVWIVSTFMISNKGIRFEDAAIVQFITFILFFIAMGIANKSMVTLYSVFLAIFYLFQNGQVLLYAFGIKYDYFYVTKYNTDVMLHSVVFSHMCMCAAFLAGVLSMETSHTSRIIQKNNCISNDLILNIAKIGFWISMIIAYFNVFIKLAIVISNGYFGVIAYTSKIPSLVKVCEEFFVAFAIMLIIYEQHSKVRIYATTLLFIIWSILTALTGDRTSGIAGVVIIGLMYFKNIYSSKGITYVKKKHNKRKYMFLIIVAIIASYLISFAFSFRMQYKYDKISVLDTIINTIGTLGFSFFPLVLVMQVCPLYQPYLYGKSMIGGLISGFVPNTIDILGITDVFFKWSSEPSTWIESYYNYGFGIDFSLNAECYANFGELGWIAMFFLCCIVSSALKNIDYQKKDNLFSQYTSFILLFTWFTLPRRKSYYIYNKIFWFVLMMTLIIVIVNSTYAKRTKNRGGNM